MDPRQVLIWSRGPPKGLAGGGLKIGLFFAGQEKAGGPTNKLLLEPELCAIWQMWNPCEKGGKVGKRPGKKAARPGTHWWGSTTIFTFFPCFVFTFNHPLFKAAEIRQLILCVGKQVLVGKCTALVTVSKRILV